MRAVGAELGVVAERTRLGMLAARCYDRRRPVLWLWIGALVAIVAIGAFVVRGSFEDKFGEGHGDSRTAQRLLDQRFPTRAGDTADIVFHTAQPVSSAAVACLRCCAAPVYTCTSAV